jgi:hypothetical protein
MEPYEMITTPGELWLAPVGESFPDVDSAPSGNWAKLGQSGMYSLNEDGVTVTHEQTLNQFRSLGATGPLKVNRSEENLTIGGILEDLSLEEYAKVLNDVSVSSGTTGSGADQKEIPLRQGKSVAVFAALLRIPSAYGDGWDGQYEIPRVYQSENPAPAFTKDGKAGLQFMFTALEDTNAATEQERFGKLNMQTSSP